MLVAILVIVTLGFTCIVNQMIDCLRYLNRIEEELKKGKK